MALCLVACVKDNNIDNRSSTAKPDISVALANYENLDKKRSDLTAELTFSLFKMDKEDKNSPEVLTALSVTEELALNRTEIDDKIYIGGTVKTSEIDHRLIAAYKTMMKIVSSGYDPTNDEVIDYLQSKTYFDLRLGYEKDVYNLKAKYVTENPDDGGSYWGATDNEYFASLIKEWDLNTDMVIADYLMTDGITDLGDINEWIGKDTAGKYFSTESNSFAYNITADSDKLHHLLFDIAADAADTFDEQTYEEYLDLYENVVPYIKKWVSVDTSTLNAIVDYNGYPQKMDATVKVNININVAELEKNVLPILFPGDENKDTRNSISALIKTACLLLDLRGTEGQEDTIGMSFKLSIKENFLYGDKNVNFDGVDPDLFLPLDVEKEGREVFRKEEKKPEESNTDE